MLRTFAFDTQTQQLLVGDFRRFGPPIVYDHVEFVGGSCLIGVRSENGVDIGVGIGPKFCDEQWVPYHCFDEAFTYSTDMVSFAYLGHSVSCVEEEEFLELLKEVADIGLSENFN